MDEALIIKSVRGSARLKFSNRKPANSIDPVESFYVTLSLEGLRAATRVYTPPSWGPEGLAMLFDELAANWRGWPGEKSWRSLEGDMTISCICDKLGHTRMAILLRNVALERAWKASGMVVIEAGQLDSIARSVREFLRV